MGLKIGLIAVDCHNFPNFALMKISAYHKSIGDEVEWAMPMFGQYDRIYASKVFTFSPDINRLEYNTKEWVTGGTGYDIKSLLPPPLRNVGCLTIHSILSFLFPFNFSLAVV